MTLEVMSQIDGRNIKLTLSLVAFDSIIRVSTHYGKQFSNLKLVFQILTDQTVFSHVVVITHIMLCCTS